MPLSLQNAKPPVSGGFFAGHHVMQPASSDLYSFLAAKIPIKEQQQEQNYKEQNRAIVTQKTTSF